MKIKNITHYCITDCKMSDKVAGDDAMIWWNNEELKRNHHSFTTLTYNKKDGFLYCGVTNFSNDILYRFAPHSKKFEGMEYAKAGFAEIFDIKLHRSVEIAKNGLIYGATSCLHGIDRRGEGAGGKVFCFDPTARRYKLLCIPNKRDYIQTITLDEERQMIYGFTYPVFEFFAYSIKLNQVMFCDYMESITHVSALDDKGRYWGTWGQKHNLFHYDPGTNKVVYYKHGFPEPCRSLMYPNAGPIDCMINGEDGYLYVATENATFYRLDPNTAQLEYLGKPFPGIRMPGLLVGEDGLLYGCGGNDDNCVLFSYDRQTRAFNVLGKIADTECGTPCFRTHDMEKIGNVIYIGETDNTRRTNYLWECAL